MTLTALKPVVLTALILLGAGNTYQFADVGYQLLWTSVLSILACAILLEYIKIRVEATLWLWVMLGVFIAGYYFKLLMMSIHFTTYKFDVYYTLEMGWLSVDAMLRANFWATVGFLTFCVVGCVLASMSPISIDKQREHWRSLRVRMSLAENLLLVIIGLYALTLFLPVALGFGQMGIEHHKLPFRLDALVTRTRTELLPILFLLLLWLLDRVEYRRMWLVTLWMCIALSLVDSAMRGSRMAVLSAALPIFVLWILVGKLTRRRMVALTVAFLTTVALFPVLSSIRTTRIAGNPVGADTIVDGLAQLGSATTWETIADLASTRIGGLDGLIHVVEHGQTDFEPSRLLWLLNKSSMATHQTYEIVGVPYDYVEGRSPGLLGAFVLVAGTWGVIPLLALFMVAVWCMWTKAASLPIAPVALAYLASRLFTYTSEGTFGIQGPLSWLIAILIANYVFARLAYSPRRVLQTRCNPAYA